MGKIVVGMSGGVDSSVAALLLKRAGHEVIGLFMQNWEEEGCPAAADFEDVVVVAGQLNIPCYTVNFAQEYWDNVFVRCLKEYAQGYTPNPDIWCNQEIKFKVFLSKALELGADYLATGHYCQNINSQLLRGKDPNKDQSYFLYTMQEKILEKVLFPIGHLEKKEVRRLAQEAGLVTAGKRDSTGICFIGKRNFKEFLGRYITPKQGTFETREGKVVGLHEGAHFYTIGQRRGLGIGGAGKPWYVVDKEMERNVVIVDQGEESAALFATKLEATEASWIGKEPIFSLQCTAKIRYRSPDEECYVDKVGEKLYVTFARPQKAITPRQSIVFYQKDVCLGGAIIAESILLH
ncbi:MAG: tRNA 2-thiouridine(34) synthase MnmA [Chlamydiales bacterium]